MGQTYEDKGWAVLDDLAHRNLDQPQVWHDDALPGALWMHGAATEYRVEPVDEYIIGLAVGSVGYQLHRKSSTRVVHPGQLVVLDPEHPHSGTQTSDGPWYGCLLVLPAAPLWSTVDEIPALLRTTIDDPVMEAPELGRRFLELDLANETGVSRLQRECALLALLDELTPTVNADRQLVCDPAVTTAVEYIRDNFLHTIDLDTLTTVTGSTKFRLLRRFRAEIGVSPHQFLISVRVAHARRLLAVGTPISEVAANTGFADQSHLTRQFRRRLGLTPGRYSQAAQVTATN
jgi:AraC-like DNA-binding protein